MFKVQYFVEMFCHVEDPFLQDQHDEKWKLTSMNTIEDKNMKHQTMVFEETEYNDIL